MSLSLLAGVAVSFSATGIATAESNAPTGANTDEIRALVADMLADADTRSSLLQSSGTAGHDGEFFLASPNGDFRLVIDGQIQFRYNVNGQDPGPVGTANDDFETGFQTRRTKLVFRGTAFDNFFFKVQGAFNRAGGGFGLQDAYVGYKFDNGLKVKWGQFKSPFLREELISSKRQLAADRSFTNEVFNQGRSQGVMAEYTTGALRFMGSFTDGFNSINTGIGADPADYAFTGRIEYLGAGSWDQFRDFTSPMGSEYGVLLGLAAHWQDGVDAPGVAAVDMFSWTADVSVEGDGWSVFGAFMGNHINNNGGTLAAVIPGASAALGSATDEYGFVLQGSVYIVDDIETFLRWDGIIPASGSAFNTITAGANYYLHGHAAKFTLDVQYFFDDPASSNFAGTFGSGAGTGIGYVPGAVPFTEAQFSLRAQFQLLF